ncbi:MAG: hypothetical protein NC918_00055 [Candidatus Omnitrophica bacterium]|nr:hypothetical protein [Candidatus Omnitrophota bacterium]
MVKSKNQKSSKKENKKDNQKIKKRGKIVEIKKIKIKKEVRKNIKKPKEPLNKIWLETLLKDSKMRKWLVREIGEHAIEVIQKMDEEITDEELAKKTALRPSDVRTVLNRLHAHGLATYLRKRDKESGWYSYIWSLLPKAAQDFYEGFKKIIQEAEQTEYKEGELYYSIIDGKKKIYTFEQAYEYGFVCPISGQKLRYLEKPEQDKEQQ